MDKNYSNDNYNLVYSDTIDNCQLHFAEQRSLFCILLTIGLKNGRTHIGIKMKQLVKFSYFKKKDAIKIVFLDHPPLPHSRCHFFSVQHAIFVFGRSIRIHRLFKRFGQLQCSRVEIGMVDCSAFAIFAVFVQKRHVVVRVLAGTQSGTVVFFLGCTGFGFSTKQDGWSGFGCTIAAGC